MAITEACQVWIEQRIEEELPTGKSYRAIGREIATEIGKLFLTKVYPHTIEMRAIRTAKRSATNVAPSQTYSPSNEIQENHSNTPTNERPRCLCGNLCEKGRKKLDGTQMYLKTCRSCRESSMEEHPELEPRNDPRCFAMDFAYMAVSQLKRIPDSDAQRSRAFDYVIDWISQNR